MPQYSPLSHYVGVVVRFSLVASIASAFAEEQYGSPGGNNAVYLDNLVRSQPDWIAARTDEYLTMKNGMKFAISDHRADKSFNELLEHPDIDDMFFVPYTAGNDPKQPPRNFDPGRIRFEPLLTEMYGDCRRGEIALKLRVDKALFAISQELDKLSADFLEYMVPTSGTYSCRTVAGSSVRSAHGYGIAIDLNVKHSDYWRWSKDPNNPVWKNQIPIEIVRVFEKHRFIWDGPGITLIPCTSNIGRNYSYLRVGEFRRAAEKCKATLGRPIFVFAISMSVYAPKRRAAELGGSFQLKGRTSYVGSGNNKARPS
jgi:D-alanyl-D-alanine carboxypeptidase